MKPIVQIVHLRILTLLLLASLMASANAQEVSIPDPGLNAAIRAALQKPSGPLTEQDLLSLTNLDAHNRNISSIVGLEAARNLNTLLLHSNRITNFFLPNGFTNLAVLDLSVNSLTNVSLPGGMTNLFSLVMSGNPLTQLTLPPDLTRLVELDLEDNQLTRFNLSSNLASLVVLELGFNSLTNFSLPSGLTNLDTVILSGNSLTNVTLPADLSRLANLSLDQNQFTSFTLPAGLTNLHALDLFFNQLTNLNLPADLRNLIALDLDNNRFASLTLPANLTGLGFLRLRANQLTNFNLPTDLKALSYLDLGENQLRSVNLPAGLNHLATLRISGNTNLTSLALPAGMTNLSGIFLRFNGLTNLTLPSDLYQLASLDALGNQLTSLTLPPGLTNLTELALSGNQLTTLTLPPDMTRLTLLVLNGNPLTTLILSEPLAATNLTDSVDSLRSQGVSVFTYPLMVQLIGLRQPIGAFQFTINGPPGIYTVLGSTDLAVWSELGVATNSLGSVLFTDVAANLSPKKFYRALLQNPPANMVFIPANTFTLGSPANEVGHRTDESPQTIVTLSHGFWISRYLVTQRDYLAVTGSNPSGFPGNQDRPVESVSWFAASNYCAQLTQQDLAAGRIPPGSHYRLPTEAEWECAARAGTSTRFYYDDDPGVTSLTNHAWYGANSGFVTRPVGQKLPNAWGLYDMEGNVWEWCQDWYGPYAGGAVTDPQGPVSNPIGSKVIRGGAWESSEFDCRSARRSTEGASPFISDFIIGFRVVLAIDP